MGKFDLTKMPKGKCTTQRWRKKIDGKPYYFSGTKAEATEKLKAFYLELEATQHEPSEPAGDKWIELMRQNRPSNDRIHLPADFAELDKLATNYQIAQQAGSEAVKRANTDTTLKAVGKIFLDEQKGEVKVETFASLKKGVEVFTEFAESIRGDGVGVDFIDEEALPAFKKWLQLKKNSAWTNWTRMKTTKTFIMWIWRRKLIATPPRNISRAKETQIKVSNETIITFSKEEIKTLLDKAPERTKLYALLALNAGHYQRDFAEMTHNQIDLENGTIKRKRTKTEEKEKTPMVTHYLWKETLRLLKKYGSNNDPYLKNEDGGPLVKVWIGENDKVKKKDNVHSAWNRLKKTIPDLKPFMNLRHTSSTMLETHGEYGRYAQYFLAQAPKTVAEKHYVIPSEEQMKAACEWLGQQFGF